MKKILLFNYFFIIFIQIIYSQNISYKVYDYKDEVAVDEKVINVFIVPKGTLIVTSIKNETFFKLYDEQFNLISKTPLTHDIKDDKNIPITKLYKLKDKIIAEYWGPSTSVGGNVTSSKVIIFEYDLSGNFLKSTKLEPLKVNSSQHLSYSNDSTKIIYWSSYFKKETGYYQGIEGLKNEDKKISFIIFDNNFKKLVQEEKLLDNFEVPDKNHLEIIDVVISNEGNVNIVLSYFENVSEKYPDYPLCTTSTSPFLINYNYENKIFSTIKTGITMPDKLSFYHGPSFSYNLNNNSYLFLNSYRVNTKKESLPNNYYFMFNTSDISKKQFSLYKLPVYYRKYLITNDKYTYPNDTTGSVYYQYHLEFNSSFPTTNGSFIVSKVYNRLFASFINNNNQISYVKEVENKIGLNNAGSRLEKSFFYKNKLVYIYTNNVRDNESKSLLYNNLKQVPTIAFIDDKGVITKKSFCKDLVLDFQHFDSYYQIGDGVYFSQLNEMKKYIILKIED